MASSAASPLEPEMVAFIQLKVACNQVIQAPNLESLGRLSGLVKQLPQPFVQAMHQHLLFVLAQILQHNQASVKIEATTCMELVLTSSELNSSDPLFDRLLLGLLAVVYNPESDSLVSSVPEELHLGCVKCVSLLLCRQSSAHRKLLYTPQRAPALGVLVCVCLKQAALPFRSLKIAALECLMACGQVLEASQVADPELRITTANVFMNFTPGIAAGLQQVICADEKQGHAVTLVALRAWGRLLAQVLDEDVLPSDPVPISTEIHSDELPQLSSLASARSHSELEQLMAANRRTAAWLRHADSKLVGNVRAVCAVHKHSHPKVRLEMVATAELLLTRCSRSVPVCVPALLEALLALLEDEDRTVAVAAEHSLELVRAKGEPQGDLSLPQVLQESFFALVAALPTTFNHADTAQQMSRLGLLLGHVRVLGPARLGELLLMAPHLDALLQGLLQAAELDCGAAVLLADCARRDLTVGEQGPVSRPWCRFRHFSDARVTCRLQAVCRALGEQGDLSLLTGQLLAHLTDCPGQRKEAALLLVLLLGSAYPDKRAEQLSAVRSVLRVFLEPSVWGAPLSLEEDAALTLATVRANLVTACIMTEGIALLAAAIGVECRRVLSDILYPLLERAGSPLELLAQAGRLALSSLAVTLGHGTPARLVRAEADYFTHAVALGLRRPADHPGALLVLSAVLRHGGREILPCLEHTVTEILVSSCDTHQERHLTAYLHVFHTLVLSVQRWLAEEPAAPAEPVLDSNSQFETESLLTAELRELHRWKLAAGEETELGEEEDGKQLGDKEEGGGEEKEKDEEKKDHVPDYVRMTEAVLSRCTYILASAPKEQQLLALSTLSAGMRVLAAHEDRLLPLVHRTWSPLLSRFSPGQDVVVLRHSLDLLVVMAEQAKSFLRRRALDRVLPTITGFLSRQALHSSKHKVETFSQVFKLQRAALEGLGPLAVSLELQEEELASLLAAAAPYLSQEQPPQLQASCVQLFRTVARRSPEAVWLQLRALWNPSSDLQAPHHSCPTLKLPCSLEAHHYKRNVNILDQELL